MATHSVEIVEEKGVTPKMFSELYPCLYHMAHENAWEQIRRYGLLSTTSILDLWEVEDPYRTSIESEIRRNQVELTHPLRGTVVLRDQKPMHEKKLRKALVDCTPRDWCRLLNRKVFFWPSVERLHRHMFARGNRLKKHLVLTLDSYRLAVAYENKITLCPLNSGNTIPFAQKRGIKSFMPMHDYPFALRLRRGPYYTVVELTVDVAVPDILSFVTSLDYMKTA
ncbi:MAG: hypothetical protein WCA38_09475 [Candidatus Acidiferrales bacterium]